MSSSHTIAFSGKKSVLQVNFLPEITLDENYDYSCSLLDLTIKNCAELKKISDLGVICIDCDIISNSYINGTQSHTIHQFTITSQVNSQKTIVEIPKHLNYFPIKTKRLQSIQISIHDFNGKPLNIYETDIICRINIKRDRTGKSVI